MQKLITIKLNTLLATLLLSCHTHSDDHENSKDLDYLSLTLAELGNITISIATGNETTVEKAPAIASVITAEQIEAMGARTLDDVIENIPGIHVALSGTNRLDSIYSIRGIHTAFNPHVLTLINGIPMQYPVTGGRPILFRQSVNNIERIEVIRGPGSAIYGADAFSGVINIITKTASDIAGTTVGSRVGSSDFSEAWVQTGQSLNEDWDIAISLNYQHSDGDDSRRVSSDFQSLLDNNPTYNTSASLAPGTLSTRYEVVDASLALDSESWQLRSRFWKSINTGNGVGAAQALDPSSSDNFELFSADARYETNQWLTDWSNTVTLSFNQFEVDANFTLLPPGSTVAIGPDGNLAINPADGFNPLPVPGTGVINFNDGLIGNPNATTQDSQLEFANLYTGIANHQIRIGFGSRFQSVTTEETKNFGPGVITGTSASPVNGNLTDVSDTDNVYLKDRSRRVSFFSVQDQWQIQSDLELIAGVRYDHYSDFGNTTNPRVALIWDSTDELTTKFLYGSAFRAPSFSELGFKNNPAALGNTDLGPETIDTYEASINYQPSSHLQTTLNLFSYRAEDLIDYSFNASAGGQQASNLNNQKGHGLEWETHWEINEDWRISSSYAWQHSEDTSTGDTIPDAPGQQLTISTFWKVAPQWLISTRLNHVADRKRASTDPRNNIDDYSLVDVNLNRQNLAQDLDVSIGVTNLFNRDAREPSDGVIPDDFPLEGRQIWLGIRYQL